MTVLSFLNTSSYQIYNRNIAKLCGSVNAAIMLSELVNRYEYHCSNNELESHEKYGEGWFYLTIEKAEERTCLSRKEQDLGISILKEKSFIEVVQFGMPCKRYFRINEKEILESLGLLNKDYSLSKKDKPVCLDNPVCPKRTNQLVRKGQTAHIYKELQEDLHKTTSLEDSRRSLSEKEKKAIGLIEDSLRKYQWTINSHVLEDLIIKYGILYVIDQVNRMIEKEFEARKHAENPYREVKTKPIEKPESYLRMSCEKNWASSKNTQKPKN